MQAQKALLDANHFVKDQADCPPFAGIALQWLVPEPLFMEFRKRDGHEEVREGITPNPEEWQTWCRSDIPSAGGFIRRGPTLSKSENSPFDPFAEWKAYFSNGHVFTVDSAWKDSPIGFRRQMAWVWSKHDSRLFNPSGDVGGVEITPFIERIDKTIDGIIGSKYTNKHLETQLQLHNIIDNYRVFAIPKNIRNRSEAKRFVDWVFDQLANNGASELPKRENEILGSCLQWDIFLCVEDSMAEGIIEFDEALMDSFEKLHLNLDDDKWRGCPPSQDEAKLWRQYGTTWTKNYRVINGDSSQKGLIQSIFQFS